MTDARRDWPIVVGGCYRSGTSLLRRILDAHPRIHCGPESNFLRDLHGEYVNDPLRHGRFLRAVRGFVDDGDLVEIVGAAYVALHERAALRAGKARWADKDTLNLAHLDTWETMLGDRWLLVHVVRNPLDTIASLNEIGFKFSIPTAMDARIAFYRTCVQAGLEFSERYPNRYFRVVYEDLVAAPEPVVRGLMSWLGEEFEPAQMRFNDGPHQSGLEDPKVAGTREIHAESVGRWRTMLTPGEVAQILGGCGDLWEVVAGGYDRAGDSLLPARALIP